MDTLHKGDDDDDDNNNRLMYLCRTQLYVNQSDQQHVSACNKGIIRLQIRIAKRDSSSLILAIRDLHFFHQLRTV
jgi:hypothetical protein